MELLLELYEQYTKDLFTKEKGKKNSWILTIRPAAIAEVREYRLTVFNNGTASLDVQLNNRTPMSFSGRLEIRK